MIDKIIISGFTLHLPVKIIQIL